MGWDGNGSGGQRAGDRQQAEEVLSTIERRELLEMQGDGVSE